jgi:hypothetical protein
MYKLARPMLKGMLVQVLDGKPYLVTGRDKKDRDITAPMPNNMIVDMLSDVPQFRGTLVVGPPTAPDCQENTEYHVKQPNAVFPFVLWVHDLRTTNRLGLKDRLGIAQPFVLACGPVIQYADHDTIESEVALESYKELVMVKAGYPGVVLREPFGTFGTYDEEITA